MGAGPWAFAFIVYLKMDFDCIGVILGANCNHRKMETAKASPLRKLNYSRSRCLGLHWIHFLSVDVAPFGEGSGLYARWGKTRSSFACPIEILLRGRVQEVGRSVSAVGLSYRLAERS